MQTWAKRGFQTALVTGGLLMLGTGIASADEDVNPDRPASPMDASLDIPIKLHDNAFGTPFGQQDLHDIDQNIEISPQRIAGDGPAAPALHQAWGAVPAEQFRGNSATGNVAVPVDISGNAVAALGDAWVENDSAQTVASDRPVITSGHHDSFGGNVVALDYAAPIQITGNAMAAAADAQSTNTATQSATTQGDIETSGEEGTFAGNVIAPQGATPVQLNGNALAGGGTARTHSDTTTEALSGGSIQTMGRDGTASGNVAGTPVALPVTLNGQSFAAAGNADAIAASSTDTRAGDERPDVYNNPAYIETNGTDAVLSGMVAQPALAGPAALDCNSAAGVGNADADCATDATAAAGGGNRTWGDDSVIGGSVAHTPVAFPAQGFGNSTGAVGDSSSDTTNAVDSNAGGSTYTRGHDSTFGGLVAGIPVAGPLDLCATGAGAAGDAGVDCDNTSVTVAGGHTGTTGDNSVGGGNGALVPVALPIEGVGNTGNALGQADSSVTENKVSTAGGLGNTRDDEAVAAANLIHIPVAGPVQAFGNDAGAGSITRSFADMDTTATAGGDSHASGTGGTLSGNIVQGALAQPTQFFGNGGTAVSEGVATATNNTSSTAGGDVTTDAVDGSGSGNVVNAPVGSAAQLFGTSGAVLGDHDSIAGSSTDSTAGGDTTTDGGFGNISGNVLAAQAQPIAQGFGNAAAAAGGEATTVGTNDSVVTSGGDITSNGAFGRVAGNLFGVPTTGALRPHGHAIGDATADASAVSDNKAAGQVGGTTKTAGSSDRLSSINSQTPVLANLPIYDVPLELLADSMTYERRVSPIVASDEMPNIKNLPVGGLEATQMPSLSRASLPASKSDPMGDLLGGLTQGSGLLGGTSSLNQGTNPFGGNRARANPVPGQSHQLNIPLTGALKLPTNGLLNQTRSPRSNPVPDPVNQMARPMAAAITAPALGVLGGTVTSQRSDPNEVTAPIIGLLTQTPVGAVLGQRSNPTEVTTPIMGLLNKTPVGGALGQRANPVSGNETTAPIMGLLNKTPLGNATTRADRPVDGTINKATAPISGALAQTQ
ncbi:MAG: hypothetical protein M3443_13060, partial [Actinomycetota bacterium]|nr:hypothetical protein [Actinomycetota bacterium]